MSWLQYVKRDPVPWLLDPANPCVRILTLRHIFKQSEEQLAGEKIAALNWKVVRSVLAQATQGNLWGRFSNPYFAGPVGTFGTLYMLAQLGVPSAPGIQEACENLLKYGRLADGRFAPEEEGGAATWLCYTGIALQTLWHFGYKDDASLDLAWDAMIEAILTQAEQLQRPVVNTGQRAGWVKALGALLSAPAGQQSEVSKQAIMHLSQVFLNQSYDFSQRDANWLRPTFPRYYETDLLELCHLIAQTPSRKHSRHQELLLRVVALQTEDGRWIKYRATPAFMEERINQPSRWLTFEAVHSLILTYGGNTYAA